MTTLEITVSVFAFAAVLGIFYHTSTSVKLLRTILWQLAQDKYIPVSKPKEVKKQSSDFTPPFMDFLTKTQPDKRSVKPVVENGVTKYVDNEAGKNNS